MWLIPYVGMILLPVVKKRGKYYWLLCALLLCFIVNSSKNFADFDGYQVYYSAVVQGDNYVVQALGLPLGWFILCKAFAIIGLSLCGLYDAVIVFSFFLLHRFVLKTACNENIFFAMFLVFPALVQCVQIRYFLATSIVVYSFGFMFKEQNHNWMKYLIGVGIAFMIHNSCIIFAYLVLIFAYENLTIKKSIVITVIGIALLYSSLSYIPKIATIILPDIKYQRYFVSGISNSSTAWIIKILCVWILNMFLLLLMKYSSRQMFIETSYVSVERPKFLIYNRIFATVSLLGVTIPLLFIDSNFHRFLEVGYIIGYVWLSRYLSLSSNDKYSKIIIVVLYMAVLGICIYFYIPYRTIIYPFLFECSGLALPFR